MPPHRHLPLATPARASSGPRVFWRSLEERAGEADGAGEFPPGAERFARAGVSRRDFVRLLGASAALAGAAACSAPREKIVPYVKRPAELTPGIPLQFATSMTLDGHAIGLLVESHEGRPTKVEGNPEHPASLGATGVFEQASVLQLYDPDRAQTVRKAALPASFDDLAADLRARSPAGLRVLLEPQSSPLLLALLQRIAEVRADVKFTFHSPGAQTEAHAGAAAVFGEPLAVQYDFTRARTVVSLDADFLASMPMSVRWAREFADARRLPSPAAEMNRLYVVEPGLSPTGMTADHRLAARAQDIAGLAAVLLHELERAGQQVPGAPPALTGLLSGWAERTQGESLRFLAALARDLVRQRGESIVIVGDAQPAAVHVLALLANAALGNLGRTLAFTPPATHDAATTLPVQSLAELIAELSAGNVDTLLIVEGNPVYTAPADHELERLLRGVRRSVHLSLHENETSRACNWFVPAAHYLESWGDARAYDGTVSLIQPLIAPLFNGRTAAELLSLLADAPGGAGAQAQSSAHELLQAHWRRALGEASFAADWPAHVQRGFIADSAFERVDPALRWDRLLPALERAALAAPQPGLELRFALSPSVYDGRFANVSWLQELPDPATKLTWDNAALISPRTAQRLAIASEDVVLLTVNGKTLKAPALILPGHADESITLHLGYGRTGTENLARGAGVNAYPLRTSRAPHFTSGARIRRTQQHHPLALTQRHWSIAGRPIALMTTLPEYREDPDFAHHEKAPVPSLLPDGPERGVEWAMTIDLGVCTGCSSCVVACQAENNVPVVGKEGVRNSREMHWLRIDRYFTGPPEAPEVVNQPMLCQHCEKAPCEYVCPVNATVHSPDGLNEMVYNRCIGTRFCSNNCPYKVRRFNWFDYTASGYPELQRNPNVTVRERGVMEKCTYCVQRIRTREIEARIENRELRPGEVVTACQQACPTRAIQFDSLSHVQTDMAQWRMQPRAYGVLHDQGTQPRTQYLAKIRNPNPELG